MAFASTHTQVGQTLASRLRGYLDSLRTARKLRADYNRTIRELEALSDRELLDLGLNRYDMHKIVADHIYHG